MILMNDFIRLLRGVKKKIFLLLGRAVLTAIDNTKKTQRLQVNALYKETLSDIERFQEYGLETYPLSNSEVFIGFINGNRDAGIALCVHDRDQRPKDLEEGEVCLYNNQDDCEIRLNNTGDITIGKDALNRLIDERFIDIYNNHTHIGGTGVPLVSISVDTTATTKTKAL